MMQTRLLGLGAMYDYQTQAVKLARSALQNWTYVLVTMGPNGANAEVLPLGSRDLLDDMYEEAVGDPVGQGYAYVARFDKTIDAMFPIDEGFFVATQVHDNVFTKTATSTITKYKPYIIGAGILAAVGFLGSQYLKKRAVGV